MIEQHISRIVQSLIALPLLILTVSNWNQNRLGQNLINLSSVAIYAIGLEYIIVAYRWYMGFLENFHYQLTILFGTILFLCKLFEKFHPSEKDLNFNTFCEYNMVIVIGANILFILFLLLVILAYACRQIYRLMTETLLSANQNLQESQRNMIINLRKPFADVRKDYPNVSNTCSICLMEFQADNSCILLPGCEHCFHQECIQGWIQNHSTCPYCRNNLRLSLI